MSRLKRAGLGVLALYYCEFLLVAAGLFAAGEAWGGLATLIVPLAVLSLLGALAWDAPRGGGVLLIGLGLLAGGFLLLGAWLARDPAWAVAVAAYLGVAPVAAGVLFFLSRR